MTAITVVEAYRLENRVRFSTAYLVRFRSFNAGNATLKSQDDTLNLLKLWKNISGGKVDYSKEDVRPEDGIELGIELKKKN